MKNELSKEDQERIEKAAVIHSVSAVNRIDGIMGEIIARLEVVSYKTGAHEEHPIAKKEGFNEAIEEALEIVRSCDNNFVFEEIEKLKKF